MNKNVTIIGGDLRIVKLSQMLANNNNIFTYGLEKTEKIKNVIKCASIEEATHKGEFVISSVPLSKDNEKIIAPFSNNDIFIAEVIENLNNKLFIAGKINPEIFSSVKYIDLLEREELAVLNCISTAEGAIQIAMEETQRTLHGSKILILGFGRIGKLLAKMLSGIGAKVYCEARKYKDIAWIKSYGYSDINLNELDNYIPDFDIIINTIPVMMLDKKKLDLIRKDCLIIDLASNPGGIDFDYAKEKEIKTIWALALPGKVAPITSAEYIKQTIYNVLEETRL